MPRSRCTIFAMAPSDDEYVTSYFVAIAICALSVTIYEIFASNIKSQMLDPENGGQVQGGENGNSAI